MKEREKQQRKSKKKKKESNKLFEHGNVSTSKRGRWPFGDWFLIISYEYVAAASASGTNYTPNRADPTILNALVHKQHFGYRWSADLSLFFLLLFFFFAFNSDEPICASYVCFFFVFFVHFFASSKQ